MADNNILLDFGEPERENSIIKVIGVGGGGGNAVNHMYREGIRPSTTRPFQFICNWVRKVSVPETSQRKPVPLPKRVWKTSRTC